MIYELLTVETAWETDRCSRIHISDVGRRHRCRWIRGDEYCGRKNEFLDARVFGIFRGRRMSVEFYKLLGNFVQTHWRRFGLVSRREKAKVSAPKLSRDLNSKLISTTVSLSKKKKKKEKKKKKLCRAKTFCPVYFAFSQWNGRRVKLTSETKRPFLGLQILTCTGFFFSRRGY